VTHEDVTHAFVMVHVPSHAEIHRKMMLWHMQGNHLIEKCTTNKYRS